MKRAVLIGSVVALILVVLSGASVFAESSIDTVNITISESCTLTRKAYTSGGVTNNTSHKNGAGGTWSTTANTNTLSATVLNGQSRTNLGLSQFEVVCNHASGYTVTVATTSLSTGGSPAQTIPNSISYENPGTDNSGWSPIINGTKLMNGGTVQTSASPTSSTVFEVTYGVGVSSSQPAGTYTGTATYSVVENI